MVQLFIYGLRLEGRLKLRHLPGPRPSWLVGNFLGTGLAPLKVAAHVWAFASQTPGASSLLSRTLPEADVTLASRVLLFGWNHVSAVMKVVGIIL